MQDYTTFAEKNGIQLQDTGPCQLCGAQTSRGIHECVEIFNVGFNVLDFSNPQDHLYRFFIVDAHTLQHPEIHGRWNNHFHLSRLHLIFAHKVKWSYQLSSKLSDYLKPYKAQHPNERLSPPPILSRGKITTTDVQALSNDVMACKEIIEQWAREVYQKWEDHHLTVEQIAKGFF